MSLDGQLYGLGKQFLRTTLHQVNIKLILVLIIAANFIYTNYVSVFGVILVRIQSKCRKTRTRITTNTDSFYAAVLIFKNSKQICNYTKNKRVIPWKSGHESLKKNLCNWSHLCIYLLCLSLISFNKNLSYTKLISQTDAFLYNTEISLKLAYMKLKTLNFIFLHKKYFWYLLK